MKQVFTSQNSAEVGFLKSVLEDAGIECFIRNESQAYQSMAFTPELWVLKDEDLLKAEELCKRWRHAGETQPDRWRCPKCGEELESQFGACWKCAAADELSPAPESDIGTEEQLGGSLGPWKPFQPWMVLVLAILAVAFDLGLRGALLEHPLKWMRYPIYTPLWIGGQELLLEEGWKNVSYPHKWFWKWRSIAQSETNRFCEEILRDAIAFAEQSRFPATSVSQLRANLVVLLGESRSRESYGKELTLLKADPHATNFVLAAQAVYETNRDVALGEIRDPLEVLGSTTLADKFDVRWRAITGQNSDALANNIGTDAAELQWRDFVVINAATVVQALGLCALGWLLVNHRRFQTARRKFTVPWGGWEGLGIVCAAWIIGLLLLFIAHSVSNAAANVYALFMFAPAPALLWWRHRREDKTCFKSLLGVAPASRGRYLMLVGLVVFTALSIGYIAVYDAARAGGLKSHWAEGIYEPELYAPWKFRWLVLANAAVIGPIGEEILFRGILFPALLRWIPVSAAVVLSSLIFAAYHYYSWPGFLGLVVFGSICAAATHATGSLVPAILAHSLNNLFVVGGYAWVMGH